MAFTRKQLIQYISNHLKTTPENLILGYKNIPELKESLDKYASDINARRVSNGLEPVIFSEEILLDIQ